jgi:hypothetical protein
MFALTVVVTLVLAVLLGASAVRKLSHRPEIVASYARAGVAERWLNPLALLLLAASAGLLGGLAWRPIGIVTAAALVVYFLAALGFHLRARDYAQMATPAAIEAAAVAALVLALASG